MNTNGIRHSRRHFAESFYNVASNMLVSISLDSADVVVNDSWRGAAGRLALQAVKNCASVGQRICVSAVVTPESATCVPQLVEELLPYCRAFKFSPIIPRSQAERAALGPNYQSVVEQCFDILEQRFGDSEVQIILPSRKISVSDLGSLELKQLCVCTRTKMYLNEKLECYPCYYSACSENLLGDAACESISEIWSGRKLEAVRDRASQRRLCGSNLRDLLVPSRYEASEVSE
jgi:MoaA/NifB/PqqE/SkfB family radical SAM enzyme